MVPEQVRTPEVDYNKYMASREFRGAFEENSPGIKSSPTLDLIRELSKPATLKLAIEEWGEIPPHVRDAVESLLKGELERIAEATAAKAEKEKIEKAIRWLRNLRTLLFR